MKKILGVIVILAAIWAYPPARLKLIGFLHPVLSRLGPVGRTASAPMLKFTARTDIATILRSLSRAKEEGKEVPDVRSFNRWLRTHAPSEKKGIDPWGNPYYMTHENRLYTVGSAGPDGVRSNADDISKTVTF